MQGLHFGRQEVIDQALACLRYWVSEMHVDGFRFDLAPVLGREAGSFDADSTFMQAVRSDPVLRHIKLIAEPWDVGPHGYCLGKFPSPWREWNDRFRDATRSFWRGDRIPTGEVTQRLEGSRDLIQRPAENFGEGRIEICETTGTVELKN